MCRPTIRTVAWEGNLNERQENELNSILFGRKANLPPVLSAVLRRSLVFQVLCTVGFEIIFVLGALSAVRLSGSDRLFGVATSTAFALGQLVIAMPAGKWMDRFGRRPILLVGALGETTALGMMGMALLLETPGLFIFGLLLLGLGSGTTQLVYLVGGDIYPSHRRAEGLGIMTTALAVGVVGGPYLVGLIGDLAERIGLDPVITPWFFTCALVALAGWLMFGLHPEPLDVARKPEIYYPAEDAHATSANSNDSNPGRTIWSLLKLYPIAASVGITVCFAGARMSIIPLLTFILREKGYSFSLGASMVAAMGFGMILTSSLVGRLGDLWGRKKPLLLAVGGGMVCAVLIPLVSSLLVMFVLLVVLGAAYVTVLTMTRVIMVDVTNAHERGSALATSTVAIGVAVVIFPTIASYVLTFWGWSAIAWIGAVLMLLAFIQIAFLRECGVGQWDHPGTSD